MDLALTITIWLLVVYILFLLFVERPVKHKVDNLVQQYIETECQFKEIIEQKKVAEQADKITELWMKKEELYRIADKAIGSYSRLNNTVILIIGLGIIFSFVWFR